MKSIKSYILTALFVFISSSAFGQINGNGNIQQRAFDFSGIEILDFQVTVHGIVDLSYDNDLYVSVDENLFEHLTIKQSGNKLIIDQNGWVEPTKPISIKLGATQLKRIKNTAWGKLIIKGMDQEYFRADMNVGDLILEGKVDRLDIKTGAGRVDAQNLEARQVSARIDENGRIIVNATQKVELGGKGFGRLVTVGDPVVENNASRGSELEIMTLSEDRILLENAKKLQYVEVKLKNNSSKRRQLRFRGPVEKPFGYGAPINAKGTKKETFPVGTRVYEESTLGKDKLLLIIKEGDEGQVLKLYEEEK